MAQIRPIFDTLRDIRGGAMLDEMSARLNELVSAAQETGQGGEIVLKLKLRHAKVGQGTFVIEDQIVTKVPSLKTSGTLLFGTPDGNLQRQDPRQANMEFGVHQGGKSAAEPVAPAEAGGQTA